CARPDRPESRPLPVRADRLRPVRSSGDLADAVIPSVSEIEITRWVETPASRAVQQRIAGGPPSPAKPAVAPPAIVVMIPCGDAGAARMHSSGRYCQVRARVMEMWVLT